MGWAEWRLRHLLNNVAPVYLVTIVCERLVLLSLAIRRVSSFFWEVHLCLYFDDPARDRALEYSLITSEQTGHVLCCPSTGGQIGNGGTICPLPFLSLSLLCKVLKE